MQAHSKDFYDFSTLRMRAGIPRPANDDFAAPADEAACSCTSRASRWLCWVVAPLAFWALVAWVVM